MRFCFYKSLPLHMRWVKLVGFREQSLCSHRFFAWNCGMMRRLSLRPVGRPILLGLAPVTPFDPRQWQGPRP